MSQLSELYAARHEPENLQPIAETYWRGLLIFAVCTIVGIVLFSVWEFSSVMSVLSDTDGGSAQTTSPIDRKQLDTTLSEYAARKTNFEFVKSNASSTVAEPLR
jgi:hypothetical protein